MKSAPLSEKHDDLSQLNERISRLAEEKSFLQLIIALTNKLIAVSGLDDLAGNILQGLLNIIGGNNLMLYYLIDNEVHYTDLAGEKKLLNRIDDDLVKAVFSCGNPLEEENDFAETRMTTAAFGKAYTWVYPLKTGPAVIGVIRIENLHISMQTVSSHLLTLFSYMAMSLNNEILGQKRKQAEEALVVKQQQLEELNRTLEERVRVSLNDLRHKDQMLIQQSRLAAMGEMLHNIAHQWRQPLNSIGLLLESIKDAWEYNELDKEYFDNTIATAHGLLQNMSTTISDFSNFFRPDKMQTEFSLLKQIQLATSIVSTSFGNQNIRITLDVVSDCMLTGFPNEYSQVLLNLFSNAKDAIHQSGRASGEIRVRIFQENEFGCVLVSDNGGGIPDTLLSKVFDPYFSTKESGTGVGLYMSKMIIERSMHGSIEVRNSHDGAEFLVKCPLLAAPGG